VRRIWLTIIFCIATLGGHFIIGTTVFANEVSEQAVDLPKTAEGRSGGAGVDFTMEIPPTEEAGPAEETVPEASAVDDAAVTKEKEILIEEDSNDEEWFEDEVSESMPDPLKPFNRLMFEFNDKLYFYALKPLARVYQAILPEPVRVSLRNVISNLATPVRLVNCLLQGKIEKAGIEFARFMVNTTTGGLGLFDVAKNYHNLEKQDEDFGQTLGHYGVKEGFYIVWPFFGSSTVRDTIGMAGNYISNPFLYINPTRELGGVQVNTDNPTVIGTTDRLNETSLNIGVYEDFKSSSIDPYSAMRDAYFEHRRSKIKR